MVWKKVDEGLWHLFINGDKAGYVTMVKYNNGTIEYQGIAFNKKTKAISRTVKGKTATPVKSAVERMAKSQRRK